MFAAHAHANMLTIAVVFLHFHKLIQYEHTYVLKIFPLISVDGRDFRHSSCLHISFKCYMLC